MDDGENTGNDIGPVVRMRSPGVRPYLRSFLWRHPILYWGIELIRQRKNILKSGYDILIDGFPRSGNTFAVNAFSKLQKIPCEISSHHHNPCAVAIAVKKQKPICIIIRRPADAIISATIANRFDIGYNLKSYVDYYRALLPLRNDIVFAEYEDVIYHIDSVIARLNIRFGTTFSSAPVSEEFGREVCRLIEIEYTARVGRIDEDKIARPSSQRDEIKTILRCSWAKYERTPDGFNAQSIYRILTGYRRNIDAADGESGSHGDGN